MSLTLTDPRIRQAIGLGTQIRDVAEFNRRAAIALRGTRNTSMFIHDIVKVIDGGRGLTPKQQQALFNTVHGYRRQISDQMLLTYAVMHAKGADA